MKKIDRRSFLKNPLKACSLKHSNALSNKNEIIMFNRRNFLSTSITGFLAWVLSKRSEAQLIPFGFWKKSGLPPTYVDDVFATSLYTGNGGTQTIINGIDLATKGGMVWTKTRDSRTYMDHILFDTVRGVNKWMMSNTTGISNAVGGTLQSFNINGFELGAGARSNESGGSYVAWTFAKSAKFLDVITWTGDGVGGKVISHALGIAPGMVILKRTDLAGEWLVHHRGTAGGITSQRLYLNTTAATVGSGIGANAANITVYNSLGEDNINGATYVAYLFAHDTGTNGLIQCGSYVGTGASGNTLTLGWEPQWLLIKNITTAGVNSDWIILDTMRGLDATGPSRSMFANSSGSEFSQSSAKINANGFEADGVSTNSNLSGNNYIYMAIRRPNKPPTLGTQVYNAIARAGTSSAVNVTGVGFAPDFLISTERGGNAGQGACFDRLRGANILRTYNTNLEAAAPTEVTSFNMDGVSLGTSASGAVNTTTWSSTYIKHFFRRAPGVFDIVCYTGTGANLGVSHNLNAVPELIITKTRDRAGNWCGYWAPQGLTLNYALNNTNIGDSSGNVWSGIAHTSTVFQVGSASASGSTIVAYLFASKSGISKIGSYTGNGSSQTINCGFNTSARFILIKRTDSTGDWYIWDSTRGIVASGNDPHVCLNGVSAEVATDDSIDPHTSGFIVKQVAATNVNVSSATYIFLAIA